MASSAALLVGAVVQRVRIPACHAGDRGFEPQPLGQHPNLLFHASALTAAFAAALEQSAAAAHIDGWLRCGRWLRMRRIGAGIIARAPSRAAASNPTSVLWTTPQCLGVAKGAFTVLDTSNESSAAGAWNPSAWDSPGRVLGDGARHLIGSQRSRRPEDAHSKHAPHGD